MGSVGLVLSGCSAGGGDTSAEGADNGNACDLAPNYPNGPVELIVPWAAGGGTDGVARAVGNELSAALGTQVNVVNRTGGSGVVGHQAIASAEPDGQTLGLATVEIGMMHWQGLTDLTAEDLTGIAQVNSDAAGLTVAADSQWETAEDLMTYIEENPGEVTASGTGQGGIWHLALVGMLLDAGLEPDAVNFVPSEGAAPALQELVAGGIDLSTAALGENKTMIDAGRAQALAVMGEERDQNFPDVPTLGEAAGVESSMGVWRGITGPNGLEENVVAELECHLENIVSSDEFGEFMGNQGLGVTYRGSEEFTEFMAQDDAQKGEIMEAAGLAK
ncbi:tripartite tricarboxylate transporter substrate binding protein [Kocuria aegyptia]|uniref:Tripartite tricarboxylate transporter substrate binding protein n=2 Tax=Kocuria aegyptia TaxID=330943 RepID=A0ABP4X2C8_9MICC